MNIGQEIKILIKPTKIFFPKGLNNTLEEGGFTIFVAEVVDKLKSNYEDYNIKLKGNSCSLSPKFNYITTCVLKDKHETYGNTFEILSIRADVKLEEMSDVEDFLTSIIGEKRAKSLVEAYPDTLLSILENSDIDKLCQVKGIKIASAKKILGKYEETKDYSLLIAKTKQMGLDLTIKTVKKLLKIFGNEEKILKMLRENPYDLSKYVDGYGFKKCDILALKVGVGEYSPLRIKKAIVYLLEESGSKGIEYPRYTELLSDLYKLIGFVPEEPLNIACKELIKEGEIILLNNGEYIASKYYYDIEKRISKEIERLGTTKDQEIVDKLDKIDLEEQIKISEDNLGFKLAEQQLDSIKAIKSNKNILVTVGGAGSGKSSSSKALLEILDRANLNIACCAFTGKASLRITEATGFPASTIHRLLGFNPQIGGFMYNAQNKLPYDVILIDETGMLSAELFLWLIEAIKDGALLVILGDTRQLTSITSGNVLSDLLNSNVDYISKTILTKIQRQGADSPLLNYIQTVLDQDKLIGANFVGRKQFGEEVVLDIFTETGEFVLDWITKEYLNKLEKYNGDLFSVVIMSPTRIRGNLSLYNINSKIKSLVNPFKEDKEYFYKHLGKTEEGSFGYYIQEGDKVVITKNLYRVITVDNVEADVFNGNVGIVTMITDNTVSIRFETGEEVVLDKKDEAENLLLGYSLTIHQMQGSECACAIVCMDNASYVMANNEILYTGISRAKKELTVFSQNFTYRKAVTEREQKTKKTLLIKFLNKEID